MIQLSQLQSPLIWLPVFFFGIFYCAWRIGRVAKRLGIDGPTEDTAPTKPTTATMAKNMLLTGVLLFVVFLAFNKTSFLVAAALVALGSAYFWHHAYRARVKPLVQAGASYSEVVLLTAIQGLWIMPLATFLMLHLWGKYSAL